MKHLSFPLSVALLVESFSRTLTNSFSFDLFFNLSEKYTVLAEIDNLK